MWNVKKNEDSTSGLTEECPMLEFMTPQRRAVFEEMSAQTKDFVAMLVNRFPEMEINAEPASMANIQWWQITNWYDEDMMIDMFLELKTYEIARDVADLILLEWESSYKRIMVEYSDQLATWEGNHWTLEGLRQFLERILDAKKVGHDLKVKQEQMAQKYGNNQQALLEKNTQQTRRSLRSALDELVPLMKYNRHWFCVVKVLMWRGYVNTGDYSGAVRLILDQYPEGLPQNQKIDPADLSKLDVCSFSKPLEKWDVKDAPVKKKHDFDMYVNIARKGLELILEKEH